MSEGWRTANLGELFSVHKTKLGAHEVEPPVLSLSKYEGIVRADEYFDKRIASRDLTSYKLVAPGEWAYSTIHIDEGSIARNTLGFAGVISPMYTTMRFVSERDDPAFIELTLTTEQLRGEYFARAAGTVNRRRSLPFQAFAEIEVQLPSLVEQRRIVDLLTGLDRVAESGRKLAEVGETMLAALRETLLTATEPTVRLADVVEGIDGGVSPVADDRAPRYGERGVLKLSAIRPGRFIPTEAKALLPETAMPERALVCDGDILITRSNTLDSVGYVCVAADVRPLTYLSDLTLRVHPDQSMVDRSFLAHALSTRVSRAQIKASARGTSGSMRKISRALIREYTIPLPPVGEQRRIVEVLDAAHASADAAEQVAERARVLRGRLRHDLLSGAHRIPVSYDAFLPGAVSA